ncbi:MAG: transcriptional regulator [Alteromonas sp. Nap_26]|nr:MAG: transcriptional regulator [Alteromonas sp. Nap_26]
MKQQFYLGEWQVDAASNTLSLGKTKRTIEPKAMDVLLLLCQQQGDVVSADDIVAQCWPNAPTGDNPVHKTITQLRKALDDKASAPLFIETIRKRGYRVIAPVQFVNDEQAQAAQANWHDASPFLGLSAYSPAESKVFFGRNALTRELITRISTQFKQHRPFTLVMGPSGSGKSSLVHAGLLPRLLDTKGTNGIRAYDYVSIDVADINLATNGFTNLLNELAANLLDWGNDEKGVFDGFSAQSLANALQNQPEEIINHIKKWFSEAVSGNNTGVNVPYPCFAIVIDRLEALLAHSAVSENEKQKIFTLLETLSESNAFLVLLVTRNDFYPLISTYAPLMKNKARGAHLDIAPPSLSELGQIIKLPAVAAGLEWEWDDNSNASVDDIILADAAKEPNCLPLLQYTLQELYLQRQGNTLQLTTYRKLGGIEGAIGYKAEALFAALPKGVQHAFNAVMPLLVNLTDEGANLTSKSARWDELNTDAERDFVKQMVDNRLFVSYLNQGTASFRVAHEAVLRKWDRVQQWITQHQSALSNKSSLTRQTKLWLADGKSSAYLLTEGKPLINAVALNDMPHIRLSKDEQMLIKVSAQKAKQKKVFKGVTVALLACLTVLSFAAMLSSQQSQQLAERKRIEAENLMGFMIGDFADKLRSVKRMDLLEGISEQALAYVEAAQEEDTGWFGTIAQEPSFELRFQHALSLQAMAEVRYYRDDANTAKKLYEQADKGLEALLSEQPNNFGLLKAAGANAFWLGNIAFEAHDLNLAGKQLKRYLNFSEEMLTLEPDNDTALMEVSYATNSMGSVAFRQLEFAHALSYFESSLAYKQRILEKSGESISAATAVADTYSWIASTLMNLGNIIDAIKTLENAEVILTNQLLSAPGNATIIENLSFVKVNIAESSLFTSDIAKSIEKLKEAQSLLGSILTQDPDNSAWKFNYLNIRILLDYYQSKALLGSFSDSTSSSITLDELLFDSTPLTTVINAVHYLQNREEWQRSKTLLMALDKNHALTDKLTNTVDVQLVSNKVLINYTQYLLATIRQTLHYKPENVNAIHTKCETLFKLTDSITNKSQHPFFLQAQVFAGYCLNKPKAVATQRRQLSLMNVPLPHYFTIINKELINDNTTQL